jgi:hypothetical protein
MLLNVSGKSEENRKLIYFTGGIISTKQKGSKKDIKRLGMVTHVCNPSFSGGEN